MSSSTKCRIRIAGIAILLLLASCDLGQTSPATDYTKRLSRVLDVEIDGVKSGKGVSQLKPTYPSFPSTKQSELDETDHTISIREFLGLRQCRLHLVIAERNSQIGKVASASQRLKNDLDILATGPDCLKKLDNQGLKNKLQRYLEIKQTQLPKRLWHALLTQAEYQQFWQQTSHQLNYPEKLSSATVLEDLNELNVFATKVSTGQYEISDEEFKKIEQTLGRLRFGDGGQLLSELHHLRASLQTADAIIKKRLTQKLCIKPNPTNAARNLQNVVNKFFINKVQAQAVKLAQRHKQLMPAIEALEELLAQHATAEFQQWIAERNKIIEQGLNATLNHAKAIQKLYAQCGLRAGNTD